MTLSQRAAQLAGPDRAVDAEVAVALGYEVKYDRNDPTPYYQPVPEYSWQPVPAFTGDLNAALTVVPEGWSWAVALSMDEGIMAGLQRDDPFFEHYDAAAATPALALLSAALAARGL